MSATPLTDAYLASRCKGENKQSWVEFARELELRRYLPGLTLARDVLQKNGFEKSALAVDVQIRYLLADPTLDAPK